MIEQWSNIDFYRLGFFLGGGAMFLLFCYLYYLVAVLTYNSYEKFLTKNKLWDKYYEWRNQNRFRIVKNKDCRKVT